MILNIPFEDYERAVYAIVPHTRAIRGTRFEVHLQLSGLEPGAFDVQGLRHIPGTVLFRRITVLNQNQLSQIETATNLWLGIS